jgi:hypothetical protein
MDALRVVVDEEMAGHRRSIVPGVHRGGVSGRLTRAEAALGVIVVVVAGELLWDLAHGSPGTHWALKIAVLLLAMAGIAGLEVYRGAGCPGSSPGNARNAASPPHPGPRDADSD